VADLIAMFLLH